MPDLKRLFLEEARGMPEVAENFRRIERFVEELPALVGFKALQFSLVVGREPVKLKHGLGFVPQDAWVTRLIAPSGTKLHVHFGLFDRDTITVSASGTGADVLKGRLLVGSLPAAGEAQVLDATDIQTFTAGS